MTVRQEQVTLTDAGLIAAIRGGNKAAYGELWKRHHRAGLKAARSFQHLGDPEDLAAEAFARIYKILLNGKGPVDVFRPYLYVTIRNIALSNVRALSQVTDVPEINDIPDPRFDDWTTDRNLDASLTARAFRSLPHRWQEALWYSEVEQLTPTATGELMALTANAVNALTFRAREALRSAWLQAHIDESLVEGDHRETLQNIGEYSRGNLNACATKRVETHLRTCTQCSVVVEEVDHVAGRLAVILLPLILGTVAGTAFLNSAPPTASAAPVRSTVQHGAKVSAGTGAAIAGGLLVLALAAGAIGYGIHQASLASPTGTTRDIPTLSATPHPSAIPGSAGEPVAVPEPAPPATVKSSPKPIVSARLPVLGTPAFDTGIAGLITNSALVHLTGTGTRGANIMVAGSTVATVDPAGAWAWVTSLLPDGVNDITISQAEDGYTTSTPVTVQVTVDTVAPAAPTVTSAVPNGSVRPTLAGTAEPAATVTVLGSTNAILATVTADSVGAWSTGQLTTISELETSLTVTQTDAAGNMSTPTAVGPFTLTPHITFGAGQIIVGQVTLHFGVQGWADGTVSLHVDGIPQGTWTLDSTGKLPSVTLASGTTLTPGWHTIQAFYIDTSVESTTFQPLTFNVP